MKYQQLQVRFLPLQRPLPWQFYQLLNRRFPFRFRLLNTGISSFWIRCHQVPRRCFIITSLHLRVFRFQHRQLHRSQQSTLLRIQFLCLIHQFLLVFQPLASRHILPIFQWTPQMLRRAVPEQKQVLLFVLFHHRHLLLETSHSSCSNFNVAEYCSGSTRPPAAGIKSGCVEVVYDDYWAAGTNYAYCATRGSFWTSSDSHRSATNSWTAYEHVAADCTVCTSDADLAQR